MNILILCCSPKRRGGASRYIASAFSHLLPGARVRRVSLAARGDFAAAREQIAWADVLLFSLPLYVDSLPGHLAEFLEGCRPGPGLDVYAIVNNGFIEGRQCECALEQLGHWCSRRGARWRGGMGIGGGTMLAVLGRVFPIVIALTLALAAAGMVSSGQVPEGAWSGVLTQLAVWAALISPAALRLLGLARALLKRESYGCRSARVLLPALIFIPVSDIFMCLSSLFRGKLIFTLLGWGEKSRKNRLEAGNGLDKCAE